MAILLQSVALKNKFPLDFMSDKMWQVKKDFVVPVDDPLCFK